MKSSGSQPDTGHKASLVLVTGPSGAGRSTAVQTLEDIGFEAIDNLPLSLLARLFEATEPDHTLVLGIDVRNRDFSVNGFQESLAWLRAQGARVEVLFLDCRTEVLQRRYSETRRRHPLAPAEDPVIGITREAELLLPIRDLADAVIDTSDTTPHDLRAELARRFDPDPADRMAVTLHSFGYKRGMPRGIDMVFDCRFLTNPYWDDTLRAADGRDPRVRAFVAADARFAPFVSKVNDVAEFLLPAYRDEGKSHLSVGFGCTGGQHRSVTMAITMAEALRAAGWRVSVRHHELERRDGLAKLAATGKGAA